MGVHMSYLREIIEAKGLTRQEVAEQSGLAYSSIVVLLNRPDGFEFARKTTQKKLADALGFTVNEIINGGEDMKRKLIEAEVTRAAEHLTRLLRTYYPEPMHLHMTIFTKDADDLDYYDARVDDTTEELPENRIIVDKTAMVKFREDGKILETIPYYKRGEKNE